MKTLIWITIAVALFANPIYGQQSSPQRVRTFAALPNWTGLWETDLSASLDSGEFARSLRRPPSAPQSDATDAPPVAAESPVEQAFFKRMQLMQKPPYNQEWQKKYVDAVQRLATAAHPRESSTSAKTCHMGFPVVMDSPIPEGMFQAMVTPEETLFLFQDGDVRHVYTDGRSHPKTEDLWPTEMGDSIGHWEGSTLVIDTIARIPGPLMPVNASGVTAELSSQAHFTERLRRIDRDAMQEDLTIDDPLRFTAPWHLKFRYKRVMNLDRMIGSNCIENDRNPIISGKVTLAPP